MCITFYGILYIDLIKVMMTFLFHYSLELQNPEVKIEITTSSGSELDVLFRSQPASPFSRGAIGCSHPFLGSLGAGAGGPGSHRAMQNPTWAFRLVAHITSREPKGPS
jgi:hypothetical protein